MTTASQGPGPLVEEEVTFTAGGIARKALIRTPNRLCKRSALLINLATDRRDSLDGEWFTIVPTIFLAAGHRVAAIDLPYHGEYAEPGGEGLPGIARAIARGEDVFADFRAVGRAFADLCIVRGLVAPGRILVSGTSRGGLCALHLMADDPRIAAAAAHVPVTHLPTLAEFRELAGNPIVARSNAEALIPALADRAVFLAIGSSDPRVSAERCFEFHARLRAASRCRPPVLFRAEGQSHGGDYPAEAGYHAGAAFLLQACAETMKNPAGPTSTRGPAG